MGAERERMGYCPTRVVQGRKDRTEREMDDEKERDSERSWGNKEIRACTRN